jgi:hypothetical protein
MINRGRKKSIMLWYHYLSYFFGGFTLINSVPHGTRGLSGRTFPSPFASPPGKGQSSPIENVIWSFINLTLSYLLLAQVGDFKIRDMTSVLPTAAGILFGSVYIANYFTEYGKPRKNNK